MQLELKSRLAMVGLLMLLGCSDGSAPANRQAAAVQTRPSGVRRIAPHLLAPQLVVAAAHYSRLPATDVDVSGQAAAATNHDRRPNVRFELLPPVNHDYPSTGAFVAASRPPAARQEWLGSSRAVPVDLTQLNSRGDIASALPQRLPVVVRTQPVVLPPRRVKQVEPKLPLPNVDEISRLDTTSPAAWKAVGMEFAAVSERADSLIDKAFVLAEKGALFSAEDELKQSLRIIAQALDGHYGGQRFSRALAKGWLALDEADDFLKQSQRGPVVDVKVIVETHQSSVLKRYDLTDVSPLVATQHYFVYAQDRLIEACGQAPVAARALYGLGKVHLVLSEKSSEAEQLNAPKAMAFQQTALLIDPMNSMAANELGVLLARFGKYEEARNVLQHAVAIRPIPETWQNLAIVHQRLGETGLAAQAHANWERATFLVQQAGDTVASEDATVRWVPPQALMNGQPQNVPAAMPPQVAPTPQWEQAAKPKTGFLWW